MSEPLDHQELMASEEPSRLPKRTWWLDWSLALLAWIVIIAFVAHPFLPSLQPPPVPAAPEERPVKDDRLGPLLLEVQARSLVGLSRLSEKEEDRKQIYKELSKLRPRAVEQRLRVVILAGELAGPDEALKHLDDLDREAAAGDLKLTPEEENLRDILGRLYRDYQQQQPNGPSVGPEDRDRLRAELGWFGHLALAPEGSSDAEARRAVMAPAERTMAALLGATAWYLVLGLVGFVGLGVFLLLLLSGKLRGGLSCGTSPGGVYVETFALYMVLFWGLRALTAQLLVAGSDLLPISGAAVLSLAALAWPVFRGVPWRQVREDIGLTAGRRPALEPFVGFACYAMTLPLLGIGLVVFLFLLARQQGLPVGGAGPDTVDPSTFPAHPIIHSVARPGLWNMLQILFLGSVVAPVVEETMFRGVLYRHMREVSCRLGAFFSVLLSATVVSFIFAVIHPQGLLGVPVLMALAYGLTGAREWRGSLVPGIVFHGITNGVSLTIAMIVLSS